MKHCCQIFILSLNNEECKCNQEPCGKYNTHLVAPRQPASTSPSARVSRRPELSADMNDHEIMAGLYRQDFKSVQIISKWEHWVYKTKEQPRGRPEHTLSEFWAKDWVNGVTRLQNYLRYSCKGGRVATSTACSVIMDHVPAAGSCEHGKEPFGSIQGGEFLDRLRNYYTFRNDSAPWDSHLLIYET